MINAQSTREAVLEVVKINGGALQYASDALRNDETLVLVAVQQNGAALCYASEALKKNKKIVLAALRQDALAAQYISDDLKTDKEIVVASVESNHFSLRKYAVVFWYANNKEAVLAILAKDAEELEYASHELKRDNEVVLAGVTKNGVVLRHASDDLKDDEAIILAAVKQSGYALYYASDRLKSNRVVALAAVQNNGDALKYVSDDLKNDEEIARIAVMSNVHALRYVNNRSVMLEAVMRNGFALKYISNLFKKDKEVALAAVKQDGRALQYVEFDLRDDNEVVLEALKQNHAARYYAPQRLRSFLDSYSAILLKTDNLTDPVKAHVQMFTAQVGELFRQNILDVTTLKHVVDKTLVFINKHSNRDDISDYVSFVQASLKSSTSGMQLLGKLMMAIAVAVAGISVLLGLTGVGALPAVGAGVLAVGLFSAGATLVRKGKKDEEQLIDALTNIQNKPSA